MFCAVWNPLDTDFLFCLRSTDREKWSVYPLCWLNWWRQLFGDNILFRQLQGQTKGVRRPLTRTCAKGKFSFSVDAMADAEWVFAATLKSKHIHRRRDRCCYFYLINWVSSLYTLSRCSYCQRFTLKFLSVTFTLHLSVSIAEDQHGRLFDCSRNYLVFK